MEDIWETHKENIRRLYIIEDKTCQQVAAEMKAEYGFEAKASQYHRHFEKWKFRKNLSEGEWKLVGRRIKKRKAEQNKDSELRINGFVMHQKKIEKALSRYSETTLERAHRHATSRRSCTPEGIVIATPPRHEPLAPLSFPVFVENLPSLRFLQTMLNRASVFTQLLSSFRHLSINDGGLQQSVMLNFLKSSQNSLFAPLSALVDMMWKSSPLADEYPTIPQSLPIFVTTLLGVVNNTKESVCIALPLAKIVLDSLQMVEGKRLAVTLFEEHSPGFEILAEILFKYALVQSNVELMRFLLQHSHIGPNDPLRFEDLPKPLSIQLSSGTNEPKMSSLRKTLLKFGKAVTPMEYAIITRSSTILRTLRMSGAVFDIQEMHGPDMLRKISQSSLDEVIFFMLDEGLMSITDASGVLGEKFDTIFFRRTFGEPVQELSNPVPHLPTGELLEWSIQNSHLSLADDLLDKGATVTEASFFYAIQCGHLSIVNRALEAGANANIIGPLGVFPLKIAAERGDLSMVQSLLYHGAEVEPAWSCSPMFWSIPSHEMVKLFLKRGVNLHVWDEHGFSPLCHFLLRRDPDAAMLLIDWGACLGRHPKRTPLWVPTPLQIAARKGYDSVVEKLLERDAHVNEEPPVHNYYVSNRPDVQDFYGDTALAGAIRNSWGRRTHIIDRLIDKGANPNVLARYNDTPLSIAIDHDDKGAVQSLVRAGASLIDPEAFGAAAGLGDIYFLRQSLKEGLCLDDVGTYALSSAVHSCKMNTDRKMKTMSFLIDSGARANGMKLMYQFVKEKSELSRFLLAHGACSATLSHGARSAKDVPSAVVFERYWDFKAYENTSEVVKALRALLSMTPTLEYITESCFLYQQLISAARSGNVNMTKAHIDAGIDVASPCIDMIMETGHDDSKDFAVELFSRRVTPRDWLPLAQPLKRSPRRGVWKDGSQDFHPNCFRDSNADKYHLRKMASKLLLGAAIEGGPAIIELVREAGLDINGELCSLEDGYVLKELHKTSLQYAIQQEKYASADALIQAGADINAPAYADRGLTALQAAAIRGHIGIACQLLEKGAEVNAPGASFEGRTALEGAAEWGRLDMVQLLLDNGADITDSAFGEAQYRNSTKFAKDEGYPAISRLIKRHRLSMGYFDLFFDDSV